MTKQGTEVDVVATVTGSDGTGSDGNGSDGNGSDGNGREADSRDYEQRVLPSSRPSRYEVESRLASTNEAISDRISALQREVAGIGESVRKFVTDNPWLGAGAALLAGILVGYLFTPRNGKTDGLDGVDGSTDELAEFVTRSVKSAIEEGSDPTRSVASVLDGVRQNPVEAPRWPVGLTRTIASTLLSVAVREAVRRLSKD